ncbi:hypothetical protein QEM13_003906 [Pseudomonas putida]|nr:hypothetical protein [Pseudomonas putida]
MSTSSPSNAIDALIAWRMPAWLGSVPSDQLREFQKALRSQENAVHALQQLLAPIPSLRDFAESLLTDALKDAGFAHLSPLHDWVDIEEKWLLPTPAPNLPRQFQLHKSRQCLLVAALHNYHEQETLPSPLRTARLVNAQGQTLGLSFEAFARLCREVDVGGRYQLLLGRILSPSDPSPGASGQAERAVHRMFEKSLQAHLEVAVRMAWLKSELKESSYVRLLSWVTAPTRSRDPGTLVAHQPYLLGIRISGVVAWEVRENSSGPIQGVIVWIPSDPQCPLEQHGSWQAFYDSLGLRLKEPTYRVFFSRFISERERVGFFRNLAERLTSTTGVPALDGRAMKTKSALFDYLATLQIRKLFDDARVLARPRNDEYQEARRARFKGYAELGFDLLNIAGLFVPALGEALLIVTAAQIAGQVYEGYEDWQAGNRKAALDRLFSVAENVVNGVLINKASSAALRPLAHGPLFDDLVPICTEKGVVRLAMSDLSAYRLMDDQVVTLQQGQQLLHTHEGTYKGVLDPNDNVLRVLHPARKAAYAPVFQRNGNGGWRHVLERPQYWQGPGHLLRTLGERWAVLTDSTAEHLLQITGMGVDQIRRLHLENAAVPARLVDALELYQAHEQMPDLSGTALENYVASCQASPSPQERTLLRDFPGLSVRTAHEIHMQANRAQVERLDEEQRVDLVLAERARWSIRERRLDRAAAGLRLTRAVNSDTERLAFGLIGRLAPWPDRVRVELREATAQGPVLISIGREDASEVRRIIKIESTYRTQAEDMTPLSLLSALRRSLDVGQRELLGSRDLTESMLLERLASTAAAGRDQVATLLGMAPIGAGLRPIRRFADGRIGYPLSGRPGSSRQAIREGIQQIFPTLNEQQLEGYLRQVEQQGVGLWQHYAELQEALGNLRRDLQAWQDQWRNPLDLWSRRRVANALRRSWRRKITNVDDEYVLVIQGDRVDSLPALPPGVEYPHVRRMTLRNMSLAQLDEGFLRRFSNLVELDLRDNRFVMIPPGVEHLTQLRRLNLARNEISLNNAGNQRLAALARLETLDLSHNPLGRAPLLEGLQRLMHLNLSNTGLDSLPPSINWRVHIDLRQNRIRELRRDLHGLAQRVRRLELHGNPLSNESRALLNQAWGVGTPEGQRSLSFRHNAIDDEVRVNLIGSPAGELRVQRRIIWETLRQEPGSEGLFRFLADFSITDEFEEHPDYYRERIWRVLVFCEQHEQVRERIFEVASGPGTCEDRLLWILGQLEVAHLAEEAIVDVVPEQMEMALVRLGRSLFRLDAVDAFAMRHVERMRLEARRAVDEIEVRLFYRLKLRRSLELPLEPDKMHYAEFAYVSEKDLQDAKESVLAAENDEALITALAERTYWKNHVRERYKTRFDEIYDRFDRRIKTSEAALNAGQINEASHIDEVNNLAREYERAVAELTRSLAREAHQRQRGG